MNWVIYYTDGTRITSDDCAPEQTPKTGIACILTRDGRCNRRVLKYRPIYGWRTDHGRWYDYEDATSAIAAGLYAPVLLRFGEYQRDDDFEQILIRAFDDPDLPGICPGTPPHPAWRAE